MNINKVLVTGGFGFIGKALIPRILKAGIHVVIIEYPDTKIPNNLKNLEIIRCDVTNTSEVQKLTIKDVDAVIHLAAQSSGPKSFEIPYVDINLNIIGTLNIIKLCLNNSIKRILFASSFVVYGDQPNKNSSAINEKYPCFPKSIYANSKFYCENLLRYYAEPQGITWNSLRMFNVYGPGQDITKTDQGVVGIFLNMLLKSNIVNVKGSLDRFRDLIYIDDVVNAWMLVLLSDKKNEIFNIGTGNKTTFKKLINTIAGSLHVKDLKIIESGFTHGDLMGCYADISKLKSLTEFVPRYNLENGIKEMIKFYT